MASHTRTKPYPEIGRDRIKANILLKRLHDHAVGACDMSATQVTAARVLLGKVIPDMKAVEHKLPGGTALNFSLYVPNKDA